MAGVVVSYDTPEKAAYAYDAALYCLHGGRGRFNFLDAERPKFPKELRQALSKSDIKAIAARFASSSSSPPGCDHLQLPSSSPAGSSQLSCESHSAGAAASKCDDMSDPLMEEDWVSFRLRRLLARRSGGVGDLQHMGSAVKSQ
ncbi:hypothetical protein Taro_052135 [Colocasia esculenta]|uniref:AP2/ERF domain-containing protein n=1 Tax=Colocasia esculenta TaxID=4460 RepID=A0A843XJB7_COLES|nr:hypothetical protein [Colocasia esculenta]